MSDISALSNQYDQLVDISEKINNSVIVFKKQTLLQDATSRTKYPNLKISSDEIAQASDNLLVFLLNVFDLLHDDTIAEKKFIPLTVMDDYKARLRKNVYLDEDLKRLQKHLQEKQTVTEADLQSMDFLVATLDTERNNLFRKLKTARG
ncbi:MAG: hypothetical protein IPP99_00515 [Chitinophagaceae bacterium]|jgi:hypothetical protein|nr:hypothetical protein [Chitinophagaceae bacterium]MBN8668998.1 hypothetical protein [Chitinophagales bacterium]